MSDVRDIQLTLTINSYAFWVLMTLKTAPKGLPLRNKTKTNDFRMNLKLLFRSIGESKWMQKFWFDIVSIVWSKVVPISWNRGKKSTQKKKLVGLWRKIVCLSITQTPVINFHFYPASLKTKEKENTFSSLMRWQRQLYFKSEMSKKAEQFFILVHYGFDVNPSTWRILFAFLKQRSLTVLIFIFTFYILETIVLFLILLFIGVRHSNVGLP